jgi:hypothetical protein
MFSCLVVCKWQVWHDEQRQGSWQESETSCRGPVIVNHRSGTQWPDEWEVKWCCVWSVSCTRRREAWVSWFGLKTKADGLSVAWPQNNWDEFSVLCIKTDSYGLVIWSSRSPRWFLGLVLKTKWAMVCRLRHKINGRMKMVRGTHHNLVACFARKQVGLGFPSLTSSLVEARHGWCMWHHRGGWVELKLKTDGSMWWATSDPYTPTLLFLFY